MGRYLGLSKLATKQLQRRGGAVKAGGLEFFPNRASLHRAYGTLAERFNGVSSVSAIWVLGQKFYHADENVRAVKRLLLPNPEGDAIKHLVLSMSRPEVTEYIIAATKLALESGAKVRWYDQFMYHSIILADIDKPTGWMHVESVLPYSKPDKRPSYTLHRRQSEESVQEMQRIFEAIWDNAKDAPRS